MGKRTSQEPVKVKSKSTGCVWLVCTRPANSQVVNNRERKDDKEGGENRENQQQMIRRTFSKNRNDQETTRNQRRLTSRTQMRETYETSVKMHLASNTAGEH